jgi:molecular chaperone GrpE (heat shock protein)
VNYKNRVDRDQSLARNNAIAEVLQAFLPALDDLARAEAHVATEKEPPSWSPAKSGPQATNSD